MLTGIPAPLFRNGQLCVYELMDEDSAVRFWEGYGKVAFEKGELGFLSWSCMPTKLTRSRPESHVHALHAQDPSVAHARTASAHP